ncbi:MAG: c-type cytochrome [Archangiaceae bacterium]|nr:c-type cytochrome [Archangiaceae bacterium]
MASDARRGAARSRLYGLASRLLLPPSPELFEGLQSGALFAEASAEARALGSRKVTRALAAVAKAWARHRPERLGELEAQFERAYGQAAGRDRPVYELQYGGTSDFGTPQALADVGGYYAAFSLRQHEHERCDHVGVEAEFMAYLCYLEAWAHANGLAEQRETAARAVRGFLHEHLSAFTSAFWQRVRTTAEPSAHREAAGLLSALVDEHCTRLRVARRERRYVELAALLLVLLTPVAALAGDGKALFESRCATCHGSKGDGQGIAAYLLNPKPRDLTQGTFRLRSTPTGTLPTDDDLLRTITEGIPGTAMPPAADLSEAERRSLVAHVKQLAPGFDVEGPGTPIRIGAAPAPTPARGAQGRQLYQKLQCSKCHGEQGKGDGPSAAALRDDDGLPSRPHDFTRPGGMKGGASAADVYRTFTTGLDGTPMPAFADALSDDERWSLAFFVLSLSARAEPAPQTVTRLAVADVAELPKGPEAPEWSSVAGARVALRPLWANASGPDTLVVRAASDGRGLALLLEWEDPTADVQGARAEQFTDGVAVQFPVGGGKPFFGMGERGRPVNIWHWRPDEELAELNATAPGTLTPQKPGQPQARGAGVWTYGRWRVAIWRALSTGQPNDAQLGGRRSVPIAFAVWNGAGGDRNGQKRVSFWLDLDFGVAR